MNEAQSGPIGELAAIRIRPDVDFDLAVPKTRQPRSINARAVACPMPDDTPVTSAVRVPMRLSL